LPSRAVGQVLVDRRGRLWVGLADPAGLLVADAAAAEAGIKRVPRSGVRPALEFESLGWAAEKLLGKHRASGQVSWRRSGDETFVFFDGNLVHPGGREWEAPYSGWMRADGAGVALRDDWTGAVWDAQGRARSIAAPPPPAQGRPLRPARRAFLDHAGRVWVTASREALWRWQPRGGAAPADAGPEGVGAGTWERIERFDGIEPEVIVDDGHDRVFVATRRNREGTLHRLDGETWTGLRCRQTWYPSADSLGLWNVKLLRDGRLILHVSSTPDAVTFDPAARDLDCMQTRPMGYWDVLTEDHRGRFWMTTASDRHGLFLREGDGAWRIDSRAGLVDDDVVAHAEDAEGRLWLELGSGRVAIYASDDLAALGRPVPDGGRD